MVSLIQRVIIFLSNVWEFEVEPSSNMARERGSRSSNSETKSSQTFLWNSPCVVGVFRSSVSCASFVFSSLLSKKGFVLFDMVD